MLVVLFIFILQFVLYAKGNQYHPDNRSSQAGRSSGDRFFYDPFGITELTEAVGKQQTRAYVSVEIRDAECYSSSTESGFIVFLGALDFNSQFLSWVHIRSEKFHYDNTTSTWIFTGNLGKELSYDDLDNCFQEGHINCVPRADIVYIRFESEPNDPWAIDQIDVDVSFQTGQGTENMHKWHFEHAVLLPCVSWLSERRTYQIGPRNGQFERLSYRFTPREGAFVRDWV